MCTGAAIFNFLHRRGGFAKSWKFIAPAVENAPPRKSTKTDANLTVLTEKVRQLHAGSPLFLMRGPGFATKAFGTQFGRLSGSSRTLLGRLPDAPRTPPGRASRTILRRSSDTSQTAPRGIATLFNARSRFCHEGLWNTIWTSFGQLPDAPRTPPGRSSAPPGRASGASRTLLRRSSDTSRTAPNRAVVCSDSVVFSNSV